MSPESLEMNGSRKDMPVLFVGHGSPMNAIEENEFSLGWREAAARLPRPKAILCISAHWETRGSAVTSMEKPRTIYDFGGFPPELYRVVYPAPGDPALARRVQGLFPEHSIIMDEKWGLDHGCWSVLRNMYPQADIPVVQLSLDHFLPAAGNYQLAKQLAPLRREGILILGSGNMVHNLGLLTLPTGRLSDFNEPYAFDWAIEASELFKSLICERKHQELADYTRLGEAVRLAVPTPEHYLPMLYALALQEPQETLTFFNDKPLAGSLTMTSFTIA
ncbi:MAG TPA: 4,5-DOPA dioxygenase extradiol [Anaerolineaceae bacterium]|nr:4,5-DOPA dioxygenase extradiol [Anaerolineaceae bacterium]HPN50337.1 4,5-DOPA dioxygenase extradiol [Anaerolineaceae bacterium]